MKATAQQSDERIFLRKARLHYEYGRIKAAVPWCLAVLGLTAVAYTTKPRLTLILAGSALAIAVLVMRWAGRKWNHVARLGLYMGMIPYLAAFAAPLLGHRCTVGGCVSWCVPLCSIAGFSAGWIAVKPLVKKQLGLGYGAATLATILAVGALACSCLGFTGTLGAALGLGLGSLIHAQGRKLAL